MKKAVLNHPKTAALMRELDISRRDALGLLTLLWSFTAEYAQRGDIGRWSNQEIAAAVDWPPDDADRLIAALVQTRWIDEKWTDDAGETHRLVIHHWGDHAEDWVMKRLKRAGLEPVSPRRRTTAAIVGQRPPAQPSPSKRSHAQTSPSRDIATIGACVSREEQSSRFASEREIRGGGG